MMDELLHEMIDPARPRGDVSRWRRFGATAAIFALAGLGITSLTTSALFTDRETIAGDLLTGTVDLALVDEGGAFEQATVGLAPGTQVAKTLQVVNGGSLALRYGVSYDLTAPVTTLPVPPDLGDGSTPASGNLNEWLTLTIDPVASTAACTATPDAVDSAQPPVADQLAAPGTGPLDGFTPIIGTPTSTPIVGGRELVGATGSEVLCVRLTLDADAGNDLQATGTRLVLRFDAEQVVNNPLPAQG